MKDILHGLVVGLGLFLTLFFLFIEINATGFNYQNEDEKVTLSFPSALQKGKNGLHLALLVVVPASSLLLKNNRFPPFGCD